MDDESDDDNTSYVSSQASLKKNHVKRDPDVTYFRNTYVPFKVIQGEKKKKGKAHRATGLIINPLNDSTANKLSDNVTRVGWNTRINYALEQFNRDRDEAIANNIFQEANLFRDVTKMLTVTISTVIMLARGRNDIPNEYYMWTELYLGSVKDEYNILPPNIRKFLAYMRYIRSENNLNYERAMSPTFTTLNLTLDVIPSPPKRAKNDHVDPRIGYYTELHSPEVCEIIPEQPPPSADKSCCGCSKTRNSESKNDNGLEFVDAE